MTGQFGCLLQAAMQKPSPAWTIDVLPVSLDGLIRLVAVFTPSQLVRPWRYLLQGGVLDRFIRRERRREGRA